MRYLFLALLLACSSKHSITGVVDKPPVTDCKHHDHHDHDDNDKNKMEKQR